MLAHPLQEHAHTDAFRPHGLASPGYDRPMFGTLQERIREVIRVRSETDATWTAKSWCRKAGLSHATIYNFFNRVEQDPDVRMTATTLRLLADAADVSYEWLDKGGGPRERQALDGAPEHVGDGAEPRANDHPPQDTAYHVVLRIERGRVPELRFDALADWTALLAVARVQRPDIHEELWARVGRTPLFLPERPTPETLVRVAELLRGR